jgi:hypothetical protein
MGARADMFLERKINPLCIAYTYSYISTENKEICYIICQRHKCEASWPCIEAYSETFLQDLLTSPTTLESRQNTTSERSFIQILLREKETRWFTTQRP